VFDNFIAMLNSYIIKLGFIKAALLLAGLSACVSVYYGLTFVINFDTADLVYYFLDSKITELVISQVSILLF